MPLFKGRVHSSPTDVSVMHSDHRCTFILKTHEGRAGDASPLGDASTAPPSQTIPGLAATSSCFLSSKALARNAYLFLFNTAGMKAVYCEEDSLGESKCSFAFDVGVKWSKKLGSAGCLGFLYCVYTSA